VTPTPTASTWLARALLIALGVGGFLATFFVRVHHTNQLQPIVTGHTNTLGILILGALAWAAIICGAGWFVYALVRAARS
jgi:hypothetical protein